VLSADASVKMYAMFAPLRAVVLCDTIVDAHTVIDPGCDASSVPGAKRRSSTTNAISHDRRRILRQLVLVSPDDRLITVVHEFA
jgi:hypothetical protein